MASGLKLPCGPFHRAAYTALTGRAALTNLLPNGADDIVDRHPQGEVDVLVRIGSVSATSSEIPSVLVVLVEVEVYSSSRGWKDIDAIMEEVIQALDSVDVSGESWMSTANKLSDASQDVQEDPNGVIYRHGAVEVEYSAKYAG